MAKRNRYLVFERKMTQVLLADAGIFLLYLLFAGLGVTFLKVVLALAALGVSALCLGYLYVSQELRKKRSLWMTAAAAAVLICTLVSLILGYPAPALK